MFESSGPPADGPAGTNGKAPESANAALESLLTSAPGPRAVEILVELAPAALDELGQVLLLTAWERQARWVAARQQAALAAVAGPAPECPDEDDWSDATVGAALGLAPATANRRIAVARRLAGPLTDTAAALERGEISVLHAAVLAEETDELTDALAQSVQAKMLSRAGRVAVGRFRRALRRAVAAADPVGAEVRHADAVKGRQVRSWPEFDGMGCLQARLPVAGLALVDTALTARALALGPDDPRGMDARRADVLVEWARTALEDPTLPTLHRHRPHISVTIDLPTLLGLAEHPGELAGYGPIPASAARALAADGEWRRLITDPTSGALLDYGRRSYVPPAALVDFLLARDGSCRFPHCSRPAERCDLDHAVPWEDGGGTDRDNLGPLCRRHHRLKTHTGWQFRRNPDASVTWTSPAGAIYTVPPPTVPPDG